MQRWDWINPTAIATTANTFRSWRQLRLNRQEVVLVLWRPAAKAVVHLCACFLSRNRSHTNPLLHPSRDRSGPTAEADPGDGLRTLRFTTRAILLIDPHVLVRAGSFCWGLSWGRLPERRLKYIYFN